MYLKLIACSVFQRELCHLLATTPHVVDVVFVEIGEHRAPERLRGLLQSHIDAASQRKQWGRFDTYDAVLLAYGICGNAASGLRARDLPLVLPRAHDCATILLGARGKFVEFFGGNPSHPFGSVGYCERGYEHGSGENARPVNDPEYERHVVEYGEENARYIWEVMHPPMNDNRALFITTPPTRGHPAGEAFRGDALRKGLEYTELPGSLSLLERLLNGPWDTADFLSVPPGCVVRPLYDQDQVMVADTPE